MDSSWANCPTTKRSYSGHALLWCGAAFSYRASLSKLIATSSRDAELHALIRAMKQLLGFMIMLHEMGMDPESAPTIRVDSEATIKSALMDDVSRESRMEGMRLRFVREHVEAQVVRLQHVKTGANLADVFTKVLDSKLFRKFREGVMGLIDYNKIMSVVYVK